MRGAALRQLPGIAALDQEAADDLDRERGGAVAGVVGDHAENAALGDQRRAGGAGADAADGDPDAPLPIGLAGVDAAAVAVQRDVPAPVAADEPDPVAPGEAPAPVGGEADRKNGLGELQERQVLAGGPARRSASVGSSGAAAKRTSIRDGRWGGVFA